MKTYMEDRSGNYEPTEDSRQIYKAYVVGGGVVAIALGLILVSIVPLAGIVGLAGGVGIVVWGIKYFKKPR